MQLKVSFKQYTLTYENLENVALEFYGKILTEHEAAIYDQECEVHFHGGDSAKGDVYSEQDAKTHLTAFNNAMGSYEKLKPKKKKEE